MLDRFTVWSRGAAPSSLAPGFHIAAPLALSSTFEARLFSARSALTVWSRGAAPSSLAPGFPIVAPLALRHIAAPWRFGCPMGTSEAKPKENGAWFRDSSEAATQWGIIPHSRLWQK